MEQAAFTTFLVEFMMDTVLLAGVPLAVATVCGLIVSFFQAITQIQDQTLSQTVKIVAIAFVLLVFGGTLITPLVRSTDMIFTEFATKR